MTYLYYSPAGDVDEDATALLASFGPCSIEVTADQEARLDGLHETFRSAARAVVLSCDECPDRTASIHALRTALFFAQEAVSSEASGDPDESVGAT